MTSYSNKNDNIESVDSRNKQEKKERPKDLSVLPPSGTSLHKRRRGEPPAAITFKSPQTPSDEGYSPCTAGIVDDCWNPIDYDGPDPEIICENILQLLKEKDDQLSKRGKDVATKTQQTINAIDELEKVLELLNQIVSFKQKNDRILQKLKDVNDLKKLHEARKKLEIETGRIISETKELELLNEAIDADYENDYGQAVFDSILPGGRIKRSGSKWKGHARFGGSLLRKPRSRSAGGDDSDASPSVSHRRRSDGIFIKDVEKSKVSKWTKVKAAFRWEKAQWPPNTIGGAAGVFAAGAMVGAVALTGSNPPSTPGIPITTSSSLPVASSSAFLPSTSGLPLATSASSSAALSHPERDSASLTPGSAMSLTPNSSCEELRMNSGCHRKSIHDDMYLHAPTQDDSSTSPSPNKLHKSTWNKMRDIIQTRRESVKKKSIRGSKTSPDVVPVRRRSLSDGGDSDAPPVLTLTIPSSEELESDPHPLLCKQRSLELGARPPLHRPPRASKWTKVKRAFLTSASVSVPSSPNRHSAFFTDADNEGVSSGCEANAAPDEFTRDEIRKNYALLQMRLRREFSGKLYAARPVATEEQLSADFRKKLNEWQRMKGDRQPPPVPARQDLSEDFLKRWDEWKRMKETNSVPAWEEGAKPDEVLVKTSTGLFKFQGISRSFTRKLHEWEKSRGIAPEASTSALLRAAREKNKTPAAPLTRTQSDGSVAPSASGSGRHHASSLSVNDAEDLESEYEREHYQQSLEGVDECDGSHTRGAVIVEVEDEEVCTAAPLVAVSPRHTPQKPVYTYGQAEARLLCETSAAITGTAVLQPNATESRVKVKEESETKTIQTRLEAIPLEKSKTKKVIRQPSIEEDALFIRKTIEEIERGCSSHLREVENIDIEEEDINIENKTCEIAPWREAKSDNNLVKGNLIKQNSREETQEDLKRKDGNGKKKTKSRARLEREQSKPSETDTEPEVDTVTVEIPRRKKRPRRASEKPRTPPASLHSDSEGEVFVLKLRAPEVRETSPEVIVKTTRKIFSPVVRSGESRPRAVIPVDVDDLAGVNPSTCHHIQHVPETKKRITSRAERKKEYTRSKSSGDLQDGEEQRPRSRPPLPLSPSSQRKPQPKETAPSIRIMIQRYNMKINEEGHTSGASSGASSPAWRSPTAERRRPLDMPVGVNIRNNPFLEREVQKSASACQLSRRDQTSAEKHLTPTSSTNLDGVLKSHSANALHPEQVADHKNTEVKKVQESQETLKCTTESTDTIIPLAQNLPEEPKVESIETHERVEPAVYIPILRQFSDTVVPSTSKLLENYIIERSLSTGESPSFMEDNMAAAASLSERAARIKAAREKFLSSAPPIRREGTSSTSDLRPGDRSSRISCDSDATESQSPPTKQPNLGRSPSNLGRSASTGMVNVDRDAWQRVADGQRRDRPRSRFSLARLAAKFRRKDESSITKLCRQSLLVQLKKQ